MDEVIESVEAVDVVETSPETGDLASVRELILKAYPDLVPELVVGSTVGELTASVETARAAYAGVISRQPDVAVTPPTTPTVPTVPAGGATMVIDPANLPAAEKIRRGLVGR